MKCPKCGRELRPSKKSPDYGLCDTCKKKVYYKDIKSTPKEKKKHPAIKGCGMFLLLVIVLSFLLVLFASLSSSDTEKDQTKTEKTNSEIKANTSEMLDYIAEQAKKSYNEGSSESKRDEALNFISTNYPNYFNDNETMEKAIYYGYYLEYAYSQNGSDNLYAKLGTDTYQAVKYVYRGAEKVEDESTQENLRQIEETLMEIDSTNNYANSISQQESQVEEEKVWIPKTGTKYHKSPTCSGMTDATEVYLSKANEMGYTQCQKCY